MPPKKKFSAAEFASLVRACCAAPCIRDDEADDTTTRIIGEDSVPGEASPLVGKPIPFVRESTALLGNAAVLPSNDAGYTNQAFEDEEIEGNFTNMVSNDLTFWITLERSKGEDLGLDVSINKDSHSVVITENITGLAAAWNLAHPAEQVTPGDTIVAVNGASGDPEVILERCRTDWLLNLTLCRGLNAMRKMAEARRAPPPAPPAWESTEAGKALRAMQEHYPFLKLDWHFLHNSMVKCEAALESGEHDRAADILERVEQQLHEEEDTLSVAFNIFKKPGRDALSLAEVKFMLQYLGFPSEKQDVHEVMAAVDTDGDWQMGLVEFQMYIGRMGGSYKLFEMRRARSTKRQLTRALTGTLDKRTAEAADKTDPTWLRDELLSAGVQEASQAYWRLVVPRTDLLATARLLPCQKNALRQIRTLAKSNHDRALWKLQQRMKKLGYKDVELWMTLAWIRELAPIVIHVNLDYMMAPFANDTHYRNQFETASSGGLLKPEVRAKWERDLFTGAYDAAEVTDFDRCKYGVLSVMNDHRGVARCEQYGDSYIILKDARTRCTLSPMDSANLKAGQLAVLDYYAHVLMEYTDAELKETLRVANGGQTCVGDSCITEKMKYKEVQIHGEVCFAEHVDRLVADNRHKGGWFGVRLEEICAQNKWKFSWMNDEKKRLEKSSGETLSSEAWRERLQAIAEKSTPDVKGVPEGYCIKGCGRKVAEGKTKSGKAFTTCCRGCSMGLGHDQKCCGDGGAVEKTLGPGLCRNGCGRKVNPGKTLSGRTFDTCCRGCIHGRHDASCTKDIRRFSLVIAPGSCRMGCGRDVAKSRDGRAFDTCCRGCATGQAHSPLCVDAATKEAPVATTKHQDGSEKEAVAIPKKKPLVTKKDTSDKEVAAAAAPKKKQVRKKKADVGAKGAEVPAKTDEAAS